MNDFFALFDLPVAFDIDKDALKVRFLQLQKTHHPDNYGGDNTKAALINHAFNTLNREDNRAMHLLEIKGQAVDLTNSISDLDFLDEMMDIRIALEDTDNASELQTLNAAVATLQKTHADKFGTAWLDSTTTNDWQTAKDHAQKLQFLGKLWDDVKDKINQSHHSDNDDDLYV